MHLLAKEKLESDLKQQWQAVREKQYRELQTLQEELKEAHAEAAAKAHSQCLQEKPFLQRQRSEPPVSMLEGEKVGSWRGRPRPGRQQQRGMLLGCGTTTAQRASGHTKS